MEQLMKVAIAMFLLGLILTFGGMWLERRYRARMTPKDHPTPAIEPITCDTCGCLMNPKDARKVKINYNWSVFCGRCAPPYDERFIEYIFDGRYGKNSLPSQRIMYFKSGRYEVNEDGSLKCPRCEDRLKVAKPNTPKGKKA